MIRATDQAEPGMALTLRVLGPLEISLDGRRIELTAGRLRALLAVLAISAGRPVPVNRLATALWGENQPRDARRSIQTYVARLRGMIGAEKLLVGPTGYQLRVGAAGVDALRFTQLLDDAARAPDLLSERDRLAQALGLWRGAPFDGVQSDWLVQTEARRLTERYLAAAERRIDIDLAGGRHHELVPELSDLTSQHPLRESLWVRLLLTLDRCGRQAEALERYEAIRVRLAEQLGTDPGPELRQIHADLLAGVPVSRSTPPSTAAVDPVPRQLPADVAGFVGREAALKALNDLSTGPNQLAGTVVITAIAGTAGVGKTTLAVHWAHQVADRFPDGQLYVNLRGFDPSGQVMEPARAIRGFLDALGVAPQRVPGDLTAQAGLYRSLLAGKRVLVLLDNARDADQVRPLLPGSPGSLVIVTSRSQLTGLAATEAAHPLVLDLLPVEEARQLLAHRVGADRVAAEPGATDELINCCARLPLALTIVGARAATQPTFPLQTLAGQLRDARSRLDALTTGDPVTDARAVFSWSYHTLSAAAARLFRLLGLHPGPDLTVPAAASLAGLPVTQVRPLVAELTQAHLAIEHLPGRFTFHDLLRTYATDLTLAHDPDHTRHTACHRMLDHYLHTAYAGAALLEPHRQPPISLAPCQPGVTLEPLADHEQALTWFTSEQAVLLASIPYAANAGFDTHTWQLARTLLGVSDRRAQWREWLALQSIALAAAHRLDDPTAKGYAHHGIGHAHTYLGRYQDAQAHLRDALDLFAQTGDMAAQARVHLNLSAVLGRQGCHSEALHNSQCALDLSRASNDRWAEAMALNAAGWDHAQLGDFEQALHHCRQALTASQQLGARIGEASTWDSLGYAHHQLGEYELAISCYQHALDLFRELGSRYPETGTLTRLGDTHLAAGDPDTARLAWQAALRILDDLDHPDADRVRAKLARGQVGDSFGC